VLPDQRPFLTEFTELNRRLRPGVQQLRLALPSLNDAIEVGTPVLSRTVAANERLRGVFRQTENLVDQPTTKSSLVRLEDLFDSAKPLTEWVTPAQTVCNYWNYMWTLLPEHLTERDSVGYTQRVTLITSPPGPLTLNLPDLSGLTPDAIEGILPVDVPALIESLPLQKVTVPGEVETPLSAAGYSGAQANGRAFSPDGPGEFEPHELPILHANPGAPTGQNGSDCQPGQTGYLLGKLQVPGQGDDNPAVVVPDIPGDRGVTDVYFNRDGTRELRDTRVPARQP